MRIHSHTNLDFGVLAVNIRDSMNHDRLFFDRRRISSEADTTRCVCALCKQVDSRSWRLAQETGLIIEAGGL
jgi:hypothetical protein